MNHFISIIGIGLTTRSNYKAFFCELQYALKAIWLRMVAILRCIAILSLLLLVCSVSNAQAPGIKFRHLTNLNGLSQSMVTAIVKDKFGFMWFGTLDGLNRYDGYNFKVYRRKTNDSTSLQRSHITSLYEDRSGNLWVGMFNGAMSLYDREHDCFINFKESVNNSEGLSQKTVTTIYEDKQNNFWVGTYWKLNLLDRKTGKVTWFGNEPSDTTSISNNGISCIFEDSKNNLWIGTSDGLNILDRKTKKFKRFKSNDQPGSLSSSYINAINEDSYGHVWIGTKDGLNMYNPATASFTQYRKNDANPIGIGSKDIKHIENAGGGKMWIGTIDGLDFFDIDKNAFTHYKSNLYDAASLSGNGNIESMLLDSQGVLWIGTYQGGINKYDRYLNYFDLYRNNSNNYKSLSHNKVSAFAEKRDGDIWIGTDGGGLNLLKLRTNDFIRYNPEQGNENSLAGWGVLCLVQSKKNDDLWVGMYGNGLDRYSPGTNTFKHYTKGDGPQQLNNDAVYALMEDRVGNIWIGTNGGGVNVLNPNTGFIKKYLTDPNNNTSLAGNFIRCFYEDKQGRVWIGTSTGVSVFTPGDTSFKRYDQNNTTWENDGILSIYQDSKGNMLIGTFGGGLNIMNLQTKKSVTLLTSNGLPDNTINSIVEDDIGCIWLSTNNGISKYDPLNKSFKNYDLNNGIQSYEFSQGAGFKTSGGLILFGGINGFNSFQPSTLLENKHIPQTVITGFKLFNVPVAIDKKNSPLSRDISQMKEIRLAYDQTVITLEFTALDYTASEKNQYAFMLEGFEKKWNYVGYQRSATYTNLNPGTYIFRVKGSNNDGVWDEKGAFVTIIILPPYWLTWWFKLGAFFLVAGSAFGFYWFRMNQVERQKILLEQKVSEQTIQLVDLNEEERKARLEAEQSRSESEKARQEASFANAELKIKNKELEHFAYVASHDLQEPLRTTTGFVELLQKQYKGKLDDRADKYLTFISDATARMKVLIKDLLDFSRIGAKAALEDVDCNKIVNNTLADLASAIGESKATVECTELPVIAAYPTELKLLFQNLVINAIKFRKKNVPPHIKIAAEKTGAYWQFTVSDNGIGIEEQYQQRIFDIFQRLHTRNEYEGSGIGLSHCKKIVELHRGKIWVESKPGEGSAFFCTILIQKKILPDVQ